MENPQASLLLLSKMPSFESFHCTMGFVAYNFLALYILKSVILDFCICASILGLREYPAESHIILECCVHLLPYTFQIHRAWGMRLPSYFHQHLTKEEF